MKHVPMTVPHNPPETYGDCLRACIASILDRDDVPHFLHDGDPDNVWWRRVQEWARANDMVYLQFAFSGTANPLSSLLAYMAAQNPDTYYILSGASPISGHSVVCLNDKIVHDPAGRPEGQQIVGPDVDGLYIIDVFGVASLNGQLEDQPYGPS